MILIMLGGILGGVFTPTEAASVAVFYGLFLAFVVYRSITLGQFLGIFRTTIELSGMVLLVIGMGSMLGYALTIFQVPHELGRLLDAFAPGKIMFHLFVQISFYIIGTCVDTLPALLILIPILTPHGDRTRHRADPFWNPGRMQRRSPSGVSSGWRSPVHRPAPQRRCDLGFPRPQGGVGRAGHGDDDAGRPSRYPAQS
jgi:Tripartite ATP-independent periplasmic transporter, DctM component